jgi:hypothetical protein
MHRKCRLQACEPGAPDPVLADFDVRLQELVEQIAALQVAMAAGQACARDIVAAFITFKCAFALHCAFLQLAHCLPSTAAAGQVDWWWQALRLASESRTPSAGTRRARPRR